jgi:hypothetical protein
MDIDLSTAPTGRLFWEYSIQQRAHLPHGVVAARVMERGTIDDYRWLLRSIPADTLGAWFDTSAPRQLTPRALALWACLLNHPRRSSPSIPWHG